VGQHLAAVAGGATRGRSACLIFPGDTAEGKVDSTKKKIWLFVVLFRPHCMLVSEEHLIKMHKNQWLLTHYPHLISLGEPRIRAHTMVSEVQTPSQ
jgi:hypothetical protein